MLIYNIQRNIQDNTIQSSYPDVYNPEKTSYLNISLIERPKGLTQEATINNIILHTDQNSNVFYEVKENPILADIYSRCFNYCHVLEVNDVYDLQNVTESIYQERQSEYSLDCIIDFLSSMSVYHLGDDEDENDVYNFSFADYLKELI